MSLSQKEKIKLILSITLLIIAGSVYSLGNSNFKDLTYFKFSANPDSLSTKLISNWSKLSVINGEITQEFWEHPVLIALIFNMSDCSLCLARVHEYVMLIDSLSKKLNIRYFCVGISKNPISLNRYLSVLPKPCPILRESESTYLQYNRTPKIIIIDKRLGLVVAEKSIGKGVISIKTLDKLQSLII